MLFFIFLLFSHIFVLYGFNFLLFYIFSLFWFSYILFFLLFFILNVYLFSAFLPYVFSSFIFIWFSYYWQTYSSQHMICSEKSESALGHGSKGKEKRTIICKKSKCIIVYQQNTKRYVVRISKSSR